MQHLILINAVSFESESGKEVSANPNNFWRHVWDAAPDMLIWPGREESIKEIKDSDFPDSVDDDDDDNGVASQLMFIRLFGKTQLVIEDIQCAISPMPT